MQRLNAALFTPAIILASCTASDALDPQQTEQEIRTWLYGYADAINEGDLERAASYYADSTDFYWIERGGLQYDSAQAARASLNALAESGMTINVRYTENHISLLGPDAAIASLKFETKFTSPDGSGFTFDGWQTTGIMRTVEGWKISGGHTEALPD